MTTVFVHLSQLEILLLSLVKAGIATPYDLLSRMDMGVGTTSPALKRMEQRGLLFCTPGPRNRMRFSITPEGNKELRDALKGGARRYWRHGDHDTFDSLRRLILLAWMDSNLPSAEYCVDQAEQELKELYETRVRTASLHRQTVNRIEKEVEEGRRFRDDAELISLVSGWIEAEFDARMFWLQAEAILTVKDLILNLPKPPNIWSDGATKKAHSAGKEKPGTRVR